MEIKSSKEYFQIVLLLYGIITSVFLLIATDDNGNLVNSFFLCIIPFCFATKYWIAVGRTFVIDQAGVIVKFFCIQKRYNWQEIKVRNIEYRKNSIGYRLPYVKGAVLCKYTLNKPRWMMSATYGVLFRSFSLIFVHFPVEQELFKGIRCPDLYVVDENIFIEKLATFGIELSEK